MHILVTGASGYVGQHLLPLLLPKAEHIYACNTSGSGNLPNSSKITWHQLADQTSDQSISALLNNVDCIIHLAGRAHQMQDTSSNPLADFRRVNCHFTQRLAQLAVKAQVKRFIYISSIKAMGEQTHDQPFSIAMQPVPTDPYGQSKWEAEQALSKACHDKIMDWVIIRPPLIYGPAAKGNLATLMKVVYKGLPLPLGRINNQRDMVSIYNLCDLIITCSHHPKASKQTFLVSDNQAISTPALINYYAELSGTTARLVPIPLWLLVAGAKVLGRSGMIERLTSSLTIDIQHTQHTLDWQPPYTVDAAFLKMKQDLSC
ncbi:NAD-dependent epimerase/dehydratase family protein [Motilimonas cestriensis]|uniref:NAD-dependent epimerase/dehydratase family protein n=1 Tax=Motilimonas cestriensis TaxID=2742685 RepID=A0ABS8W4X8_9GAMM|nr:NAD-dependent epimerase/dehydratase family protein [Motilimonas cestriensis]MCE2594031.1 NAD-dependent epimerase/dehydratase family protein [Motilimonas cestriensis]